TKRVVFQLPGMEAVTVRREIEYRATDAGALTLDLYFPSEQGEAGIPAVIFIVGYPDPGVEKILGCKTNEMESYISWAQLVAASGLAAITYTTGRDPATDLHALLDYVRQNAAGLGIDQNRISLWACSGHVPTALSLLLEGAQKYLQCAVF